VPLVFPAGKAASVYRAASVPWSDRDGNCLKFRQFVVIAWGAKRWAYLRREADLRATGAAAVADATDFSGADAARLLFLSS